MEQDNLKEEEHKARAAKKDEIVEILKACTNIRDRLLMLLLAETGYRIFRYYPRKYSQTGLSGAEVVFGTLRYTDLKSRRYLC